MGKKKIWYTNADRTGEWQADSIEEIPDWGIPNKRAFRKRPKKSEQMKGHSGYWLGKKMPKDSRGETLHKLYESGKLKVWNEGLSGDPRCKGGKPGEHAWNYQLTAETDERVAKYVEAWHSGDALQKEIETKTKNHSFNTSGPEKALVKYYKDIYGEDDILSNQIVDNRYPFMVDIYIKSEDKFIELDGTWTHGNEPYDPQNPEHQLRVIELQEKSKSSKYYKNALYNWIVRDPLKLEYVYNNNLNFERITYKNKRKVYEFSNGIIINK